MIFPVSALIKEILKILGVLGSGQQVSAEDSENIAIIIRGTAAMLEARGIISLVGELACDEIPDELLLPLARIVAYQAAAGYGVPLQELTALKIQADESEQDILSLYPSTRGEQPTPGTYF